MLEGESGANDPVGIALMAALLAATGTSGAAALRTGAVEFGLQMSVGAAVGIRAVALLSGRDHAEGEDGAVRRAVERAYGQAEIGPDDIDVVELHDAAAPGELFGYEDLRLCGPGEAPKLLAGPPRGASRPRPTSAR